MWGLIFQSKQHFTRGLWTFLVQKFLNFAQSKGRIGGLYRKGDGLHLLPPIHGHGEQKGVLVLGEVRGHQGDAAQLM